MRVCGYSLTSVAFAALTALAVPANAQSTDPTGVWLDHTGRGAIEITPCGDALCGRLVWTKDSSSKEACGVQILGEVKSSGSGVWDKGWIFDPEENSKYSVELKPLAGNKLRVVGYLGTKLFSETMTWTRAPANLQRCDATEQTAATAPATPPAAAPQSAETTVPQGDSKAAEAVPPKEPLPPAAAESAPQKKPSRQANARPQNCKVDTPWITVQFPCPD